MLDLQELQIIAQLLDNMEISITHFEKSFNEKDNILFEQSKKETL